MTRYTKPKYTKPNRYEGRREIDQRTPYWVRSIHRTLVWALACLLSGLAVGLGQPWLIVPIWLAAVAAYLWLLGRR